MQRVALDIGCRVEVVSQQVSMLEVTSSSAVECNADSAGSDLVCLRRM